MSTSDEEPFSESTVTYYLTLAKLAAYLRCWNLYLLDDDILMIQITKRGNVFFVLVLYGKIGYHYRFICSTVSWFASTTDERFVPLSSLTAI